MAEPITVQTLSTDLAKHPAVRFWGELRAERVTPVSIQVLKEGRKSSVYRLNGIGPGGSAVIAKRSRQAKAQTERTIYEEVLPRLPVPSLPYYGFAEEEGGEYGWFFLASAEGEKYSPLVEEHRTLAARWLGLVHASAAKIDAATRLPDRGPGYYLENLRSARDKILRNLANPALAGDERTVLETVIGQCEAVLSRWDRVEKWCQAMPWTLVHGDFAPKNMHVRAGPAGNLLLPFDWGSAGWGVTAADLAQSDAPPFRYWATPDLETYCSSVRGAWPSADRTSTRPLAVVGKIFRCLVCINLDAEALSTEWVERCVWKMRFYRDEMADAIRAAEEVG